jgi:hypothetical protein
VVKLCPAAMEEINTCFGRLISIVYKLKRRSAGCLCGLLQAFLLCSAVRPLA